MKSINDLLSKAAQSSVKPSKSKTPIVNLPEADKAITKWLKANADLKDAEARKADAESEILPLAEEARVAECRRDGKFYSSVKVDDKILISTQNRYSQIDPKDYSTIEEYFSSKAEDFFKSKTDISLTEAALNDETILKKLIAAIGEENIRQYFNVKQYVVPTETFHEARSTNAEVGKKAQELMDQGILKPYKSAVKPG